MRSKLRKVLKNKGLYFFIRFSQLFRLYQLLFKPELMKEEKREIAFYKSFLPHCNLVFDIGAYDGHKSAAFLSFSNKIVACEPDNYHFHFLEARFRSSPRVTVLKVGLDNEEGTRVFYRHHDGSAFNTLSKKWRTILESSGSKLFNEEFSFDVPVTIQTTTLDQLIDRYGKPDFIKIDVEGNELNVLSGLSTPVRFLSFEANLPDFHKETVACLQRIQELSAKYHFNFSISERLELPEFVSYKSFINIYSTLNYPSIEIICKIE